ncbi:MAG: shikimate kinase [Bacteroidales bacterium]|nr:shikimate kinase [Bacteroidales bacterium]
MDCIVLVGFSGAGKSTIAKKLAAGLGFNFWDTDECFEQEYKISISDFFEKYGESAFRICERRILNRLLTLKKCVIATGGGTPCFYDNNEKILRSAYVIYIKLSAASLAKRLKNSRKPRPLTSSLTDEQLEEYVNRMLLQREKYYSMAHLTVKGENFKVKELLQLLDEKGIVRNVVAPPGIEPEFKV